MPKVIVKIEEYLGSTRKLLREFSVEDARFTDHDSDLALAEDIELAVRQKMYKVEER